MYEDRRSCNRLSHLAVDSAPEQSYHEVEMAGPGVPPLDFPTPTIGLAEHLTQVRVFDHKSGRMMTAKHILVPHPPNEQRRSRRPAKSDSVQPNHAYLAKTRLSMSSVGKLRLCTVLRCRTEAGPISVQQWETTDELVVLKSSIREPLMRRRPFLRKDAFCEVAAQQYVGNYHPRCLGSYETFQDDEFLYSVLRYCPGHDLYSKLVGGASAQKGNSDSEAAGAADSHSISSSKPALALEESQAREWFCQLLEGVAHLQKKGVCHGGLCLENILVDQDGCLVLSDFGLALRIPYDDESGNIGGTGITDVSEGSMRRLMRCLLPGSQEIKGSRMGGNPMFMAPELINIASETDTVSSLKKTTEERVFDGFSVDLWSLGIVLFVMLTGSAPFRVAHESDARFVQISRRGLLHKHPSLQNLSPGAIHLLQNVLWADPRKRLALADIIIHPWVSPPEVVIETSSFDSAQDDINHFPSKKRLHHLSFYQFHSFGEHVIKTKCTQVSGPLEVPQVLQADERMASF